MQPAEYSRTLDFTEQDGDDTNHSGINSEFDAVALSIEGIRENLALIQEDDGTLKAGIINSASVSAQFLEDIQEAVAGSVADDVAAAAASANTALTAVTAAAGSATAASDSAAAAATSETASALNATAAATSAAASATSATAAAGSATAAATSATTATTQATNAATSATAAAASATTATTQATASATSATAAAGSATAAATSATAAAGSATAAATSATNAANSATAAANSATAAATSETNAAASATAAAASAASVNDANLVHKTGNETIAGVKTFSDNVKFATGANIGSAANINFSTAGGNTVHVTGTTAISAPVMSNGQLQVVIFDGACPLTHHATNHKLLGGVSFTTVAGAMAVYQYDGTTVRMLMYHEPGMAPKGPAFSAYLNTSTQSISSGVDTVVACQTEEFDTNSCYDTSTYRFTPNVEGYYLVNGKAFLGDSTSMTRALNSIYKNGAIAKTGTDSGDANGYGQSVTALIYLNGTTDYVDMRATVVASSGIVRNGAQNTFFQAFLARFP